MFWYLKLFGICLPLYEVIFLADTLKIEPENFYQEVRNPDVAFQEVVAGLKWKTL